MNRIALALLAGLASCGGKTADGPVEPTSETGAPDTAILQDTAIDAPNDTPATKFPSYTGTITSAQAKWLNGPSPSPAPASQGWVGRFDPAPDRLVVSPAFDEPVRFDTTAATIFSAGHGLPPLQISAHTTGGTYLVDDTYDTFELTFDDAGHLVSGRATGTISTIQGDVAWSGTLEATLKFVPDTLAPTFRGSARSSIAPVALPWDVRVVEASESYEGTLPVAMLVDVPGAVVGTKITSGAWTTAKERGLTLHPLDWDVAPNLHGLPAIVRDLASNESGSGKPIELGGVKVPRRASAQLLFGDADAPPYVFGDVAKTTTTGCKSGTCFVVGPFAYSQCGSTRGGFATRLTGSGSAAFEVRAVATPNSGPPSEPPPNYLRLTAAVPIDSASSSVDIAALKWPSKPATDGSYDTGFVRVFATAPNDAAEMGLALTVGGGDSCGNLVRPISYDLTVFVQQVTVTK